jgi:hypothetical protein
MVAYSSSHYEYGVSNPSDMPVRSRSSDSSYNRELLTKIVMLIPLFFRGLLDELMIPLDFGAWLPELPL